jgi:hypothetical protein
VEKPPGHGSHVIEEAKCFLCLARVDGSAAEKESEMSVNLTSRTEGDSEVVQPIATDPPIALCEIRGNR